MNIAIAAVLVQSWINDDQIALFAGDAEGNYEELMSIALELDNTEMQDCLEFIKSVKMIHILANDN